MLSRDQFLRVLNTFGFTSEFDGPLLQSVYSSLDIHAQDAINFAQFSRACVKYQQALATCSGVDERNSEQHSSKLPSTARAARSTSQVCPPVICWTAGYPEYDIASLFLVSFYCFVTKACARRPGAASQAFSCMHILWGYLSFGPIEKYIFCFL